MTDDDVDAWEWVDEQSVRERADYAEDVVSILLTDQPPVPQRAPMNHVHSHSERTVTIYNDKEHRSDDDVTQWIKADGDSAIELSKAR